MATEHGRRVLATAVLALVFPGALWAETLAELAARERKRREAKQDTAAPLFTDRRWPESYVLTQTNLSLHQAMVLRGHHEQVAGTLIGNRFCELKVVGGRSGLARGPGLHPFFRSFEAR